MARNNAHFEYTARQRKFLEATANEVLFGGAAGGGKSHGQLIDALLYAIKYPGSKQLILRRTFAELDKSLIRTSLGLYPREIYKYNTTGHVGKFKNGSIIDFGYCATENDVYQYQSAEYDVIRFDELTHFTEEQYTYLISRVRGANNFPKQVKSSTNPGGVGHTWVKERFIDAAEPEKIYTDENGNTRVFIPSKIDDNVFLMKFDPAYKRRLENLDENQRKALLHGDWNIFDGQYFTEFDINVHVIEPFDIPEGWRRYRTIDYGLDRFVCLWIAVDPERNAYVYREFAVSDMMISDAATKMRSMTDEREYIYATLAPPDMWNRSQETGKSKAVIFREHGVDFTKTSNDRESGWLSVKELLKKNSEGKPRIYFFRHCTEIIKCLPMLQIDKKRPTDTMTEPHELTHAPDALRGFAIYWVRPNEQPAEENKRIWTPDMWQDYYNASEEERKYIIQKYGTPK